MALDISALAAKGMAIGFGLVGGSLEAVTLHLGKAAGAYDPGADTITPTGGTDQPVKALAFKRKNQQPVATQIVERQFTTDTETLMVQNSELTAGTVITEEDTVLRADGQEWAILLVQPVPSKNPAAWLLDVRR